MRIEAKPILGGHGKGPALITDRAVNLTAAFTKPSNLLPFKRSEFRDRHHPWFGENIRGKVLLVPTCIGSTHTGLVVLDLVSRDLGPAAIIVDHADSLLVSGVVLSEVWYGPTTPVVEFPTAELANHVKDGETIEVFGDTGIIEIPDAHGQVASGNISSTVCATSSSQTVRCSSELMTRIENMRR